MKSSIDHNRSNIFLRQKSALVKFISATAIESSCPSAGLFEDSVRVVPKSEHHLVSQLQYAFETSKRKREKRGKKKKRNGANEIKRGELSVLRGTEACCHEKKI